MCCGSAACFNLSNLQFFLPSLAKMCWVKRLLDGVYQVLSNLRLIWQVEFCYLPQVRPV